MKIHGALAFVIVVITGVAYCQFAPENISVIESALQKAFPDRRLSMPVNQHEKTKKIVLEGGHGNKPETAEVTQLASLELADGVRIIALSVDMTDRRARKREEIDRQQFGDYEETSFMILVQETRDGNISVHRVCAAVSNEVWGVYADCETMRILGPNREQLGTTYISYFQNEDAIGMRKTKIIYDIPSAREIFATVTGEASTADSEQKHEWSLSYHKVPNSSAMQIRRMKEGGDEVEVYTFDGTAYVKSGTESKSSGAPASFKGMVESYKIGMEWRGKPAKENNVVLARPILMTQDVDFDELSEEELMKIVKAAYPESKRIVLIGKMMSPSRWGDQTNWTGEVEFRLENPDSSNRTCFLVWPARSVLTDGDILLSGLILPNRRGTKHYREASRMRITRKETAEAIFACVRIDSRGGETGYRDVVVHGVLGIDEIIGSRSGFHIEPGEGLFREVAIRSMRIDKLPVSTESVPIEEDSVHIYELTDQKLVLNVAYRAMCGSSRIFAVSGDPQWKDVDGDGINEVLLKDAEDSAYIYKWEQGRYAYWMHNKIELSARPYRPTSINPSIKSEIHVKDENGNPVGDCEISVEITTKHQNVLDLTNEPKVKYEYMILTTNSEGCVPLEAKAFAVTIVIRKAGYAQEKMRLRPFAEPIPSTLNITLRKRASAKSD